MRVELTGRHADISPALRRFVNSKLARLERMLNDAAVSAQVVLTSERHLHRADVTLHARGEHFLHSAGTALTWPGAVTQAVDRLVQQGSKVKGKWQQRKRRAAKTPAEAAAPPESTRGRPPRKPAETGPRTPRMPQILRTTRQTVTSMSVADAARAAASNAHGIVVFRDADTRAISVLYRDAEGELILVETS